MKRPSRVCKRCDSRKPLDGFRSFAKGKKHSRTCLSCESIAIRPRTIVNPENTNGYCYIVLLPTGEIKIGFTVDLMWRWNLLAGEYGGRIIPLAVLPGGQVTEDRLKFRFSAFRQPGNGERFSPDPSLLAFASEAGFAEGCGVRDSAVIETSDPWVTVPPPKTTALANSGK